MSVIDNLRELLKGTTPLPWGTEPISGSTREGVPCFAIEREINGVLHAVISGCGGCEVTRRDTVLAASAVNALPALLAVVEAQAAEIEAWRAFSNGAEDSNWREAWEDHGNACCEAEEKTDAALRAMEGGNSDPN